MPHINTDKKGQAMTQEAVVIENGRESDWVDPVINLEEDQFEWRVFNGH